MERKVPVATYVAFDKTVIGEAVIHEDGTCTMTLTAEAVEKLRVTDHIGGFSLCWFHQYTEEEIKNKQYSHDMETPARSKIYDPALRLNLLGNRTVFVVQNEVLEPVQPRLEDVLKAGMYEGYLDRIKPAIKILDEIIETTENKMKIVEDNHE